MNFRRNTTKVPMQSFEDLEGEIAAMHPRLTRPPPLPDDEQESRPADFGPPSIRTIEALPEYVTHADGVDLAGRLTAHSLIKQFETAALEVEGMGTELKERLRKLDDIKGEALVAIEEIEQTAAAYRAEGARIFKQIEDAALVTADVRSTCAELKKKIARDSA